MQIGEVGGRVRATPDGWTSGTPEPRGLFSLFLWHSTLTPERLPPSPSGGAPWGGGVPIIPGPKRPLVGTDLQWFPVPGELQQQSHGPDPDRDDAGDELVRHDCGEHSEHVPVDGGTVGPGNPARPLTSESNAMCFSIWLKPIS